MFPAPVRLGARAVAWRESEVDEWINALSRIDQNHVRTTLHTGHTPGTLSAHAVALLESDSDVRIAKATK